jgi:hypothetical protein
VSASDPNRQLFQIEFDPRDHPEMATGAEIIGTAIYHALGYNVVDTYLIDLDTSRLTIAAEATITVQGRTRPFTRRDLDDILRRSARQPDGRYRATASRFADGRYVGPFRYYGTRSDDPNDIYPHEHRRELRANRVFCAWLNHDDSRAINSLDMLVGAPGQQFVKHYLFDFGSILGSGTNDPDHPWVGHEYVVEPRNGLLTLISLGLWRRPFLSADARADLRGAGRFTADHFDPVQWRPHYRNPAFDNMQPEDAFWAARRVAAFTPQIIAAIVGKARFSDPRTTDHVIGTLLQRRERVLRTWLNAVNPIVDVRIRDGWLEFVNAATAAAVANEPEAYDVRWFTFDNETDHRIASSPSHRVNERRMPTPNLDALAAAYVGVEIRTQHREHPQWAEPVRAYFRRAPDGGWTTVGAERAADRAMTLRASR